MNKKKIIPIILILIICAVCITGPICGQAKGKDYITTEENIWQKEFCYGMKSAPYAKYENYQGKIKMTFNKHNEASGRFEDVYENGELYTYISKGKDANYETVKGTINSVVCRGGTGSTLTSISGLNENTIYMLWCEFDDEDGYNSYLVVEFIVQDGVAYFGRSLSNYTEENYLAGIAFFDYVKNNYTNVLNDFENSTQRYEANDAYILARELVKNCNTDYEKVVVLHRWLVENIIYQHNGSSCADCLIKSKQGVCGGIAIMTSAMFNGVGIPCIEVSSSKANHAWNMIYVDGRWLVIDNTNGSIHDYPSATFDWTTARVVPFDNLDEIIGIDESYYEDEMGVFYGGDNISVGDNNIRINVGQTVALDVYTNICTKHKFEWVSGDESILRVDSTCDDKAVVTALHTGKTTITCKRVGSKELSCTYEVIILDENVDVDGWDEEGLSVKYITHVQSYGWRGDINDTSTWSDEFDYSGTTGSGKRLEGIKIVLDNDNILKYYDLGIQYTTHCQSYGWLPWSSNGEMSGTEGEAKRLEAIKIQLTGADKDKYDVYYRVHAQSYGWLNWAKNGSPAGTAGLGKRLEAVQIVILEKGEDTFWLPSYPEIDRTESYIAAVGSSPIVNYPATSNTNPIIPGADTPNVTYRTHVQSFGWQGWKYNGQMSGTSGKAKRLEGININLTNKPYDGDIVYTTHVQKYGWKDGKPEDTTRATWKRNGAMSGTSGEAKRLEAICIDLTGEMAEHYDIYYRVHAQSFGWLGWAKNGEESGTAGYAKRLEGIQIVLIPKGGAGPAENYGGVTSARTEAYIAK